MQKDIVDEDFVQSIFHYRKGKAGARTIKMLLQRHFWMIVNLKKVRRIMKKYELKAVIRRRNKYSFPAATKEHKSCYNYLNRKFNPAKSDMVYSTDITYLNYGTGKAYLSAVKDLGTREIVHYQISKSPNLMLVMEGLNNLLKGLPEPKRKKLTIHSDQGFHYTSSPYRHLLKNYGVRQSMSRKGNCLDNAPIESFLVT